MRVKESPDLQFTQPNTEALTCAYSESVTVARKASNIIQNPHARVRRSCKKHILIYKIALARSISWASASSSSIRPLPLAHIGARSCANYFD